MSKSIEELKHEIKKGKISYFNLTESEIENITKSLEDEISMHKKEIKNIQEKIDTEKTRLENLKK